MKPTYGRNPVKPPPWVPGVSGGENQRPVAVRGRLINYAGGVALLAVFCWVYWMTGRDFAGVFVRSADAAVFWMAIPTAFSLGTFLTACYREVIKA